MIATNSSKGAAIILRCMALAKAPARILIDAKFAMMFRKRAFDERSPYRIRIPDAQQIAARVFRRHVLVQHAMQKYKRRHALVHCAMDKNLAPDERIHRV